MVDHDLHAILDRAVPEPDVEAAWRSFERRVSQRRRRAVAVSSVAAVAVIAIIVAAVVQRDRRDERVRVSTPGVEVTHNPTDQWTSLPPPPLGPRTDPVVLWMGDSVFVWGGYSGINPEVNSFRDGAVYNPADGTWERLPDAPRGLSGATNRSSSWSEDQVVIVGRDGALVWDRASDAWTEIALPAGEFVGDQPFAVVTPSSILLPNGGLAWDRAEHRWIDRAPLPQPLTRASGVWTGDEVVIFGAPADGRSGVSFTTDTNGTSWHSLPRPGLQAQAVELAWTGRAVIAVNYDMSAANLGPDSKLWMTLPDAPMRFYEWYPSVSADDGIVAAEFGNGIAAATDETLDATGWTPLPRPTDNMDEPRRGTTIVGGRSLYAWTGPGLSALGLTIANDSRIAPARDVPIGVAQLETNSAVRLASARYRTGGQATAESVVASVEVGDQPCGVTVSNFAVAPPPFARAMSEGHPETVSSVDGVPDAEIRVINPTTAHPNTRVRWLEASTDMVELSCPSGDAARELAAQFNRADSVRRAG